MRIIPVLDLKAGRAVHAVAGDRAHYRPLRSVLHAGSNPLDLARAFRERLGLADLYVADLDAIAGATPSVHLFRDLVALGITSWVDAGVHDCSSLDPLLDADVSTIVAGLETLKGPAALADLVAAIGPARLVFSLDLRDGLPLVAAGSDWTASSPLGLAEAAIGLGVRRILLLDLAHVGTRRGIGTAALLARLAAAHPRVEFAIGGGIAGAADLRPLADAGATAVLVGSALHDGRIGRAEVLAAGGGEEPPRRNFPPTSSP